MEGSAMMTKATGQNKKLAVAKDNRGVMPSQKAMDKLENADLNEYSAAFSTRPKIPRYVRQARYVCEGQKIYMCISWVH